MLFNKDKCKILHLGQNNLIEYQQAGDSLARKELCWKRPGSPGGQAEREKAVPFWDNEGQLYNRLH